jgi:glycosyltransferase involved in cell wall biosynthesis
LAFQKLNPDYHLILAGGKGWNDSEEFRMIKDSKNIRHIGKVDEEDMSVVYSLATAFVFPSFYEGFGLPIIEAQSCGCPVICSKTSSLYEIGKNSAVFFDPYDVNDMAKKIDEVMCSQKLRTRLKKAGLVNAGKYDWDKYSKELLELIR